MHDESKVGKFIVFKIADYLLALPIGDVLKVVNCSAATNRGLRTMGFVQLGRYMVRVLDLREQLGARQYLAPIDGLPSLPNDQRFLVITRGREGELCGISVDAPPNLVDLPLEMIQSLPQSDRHGKGALAIVSHAAVVTHEEVTTTIFLLDMKRVPNTAMNDSLPLSLQPS
jgi:purine-binding chemotaxis protein CheW